MSEEEDYDELPPITVNSSNRDSSSFSMPCASELASERARAERCEEELRRLRRDHLHATEELGARAASDSSGSEGEAALAAAVCALRVRAPAAPRAAPPALLAALAPRALPAYLRAAARCPHKLPALDRHVAAHVGRAVERAARAGGALADGEALACGAWLCSALAAPPALGARRARAARHALLLIDDVATHQQVEALRRALEGAGGAWEARARLELSDALRGGGARASALADGLLRAALALLLPLDNESGAAAAWRRRDARAQYAALAAAGRARAHGGAHAALLAALAAAPPHARDHCPDTLKVLVAASKLQVLFRVKK